MAKKYNKFLIKNYQVCLYDSISFLKAKVITRKEVFGLDFFNLGMGM